MSVSRPLLAASLAGLFAATLVTAANAQVYRITGPDGRVTFSDKPPPEPSAKPATAAPSVPMQAGAAPQGGGNGALPFELRQVVSKYPVTLYTGANCTPCGSGRALLTSRGVPFTERTVTSNDDIEALQRISGAANLPLVTIGGQQLKGYSDTEWTQFLDAAGYPKTSKLPSAYRQPAAAPLVAVRLPAAAAPESAAAPQQAPAPAAAAPAPTGPGTSNPTGIRF